MLQRPNSFLHNWNNFAYKPVHELKLANFKHPFLNTVSSKLTKRFQWSHCSAEVFFRVLVFVWLALIYLVALEVYDWVVFLFAFEMAGPRRFRLSDSNYPRPNSHARSLHQNEAYGQSPCSPDSPIPWSRIFEPRAGAVFGRVLIWNIFSKI